MTKRNPLRAVQKKAEKAEAAISNIAERADRFKITDAQSLELRSLESGIVAAKCAHSDIERQIRIAQNEKDARHQAVEQHMKMYNDRIGSLAREYGIDPDDPSKGRWNFDALTGVFSKNLQ